MSFKVKQLPQAKTNRRTLKTKVVSLIKNGEFLVPEAINKAGVHILVGFRYIIDFIKPLYKN